MDKKSTARYNMTSKQGNPVNVPEWMLDKWLKAQEETEKPDPKFMEQMLDEMEALLEDL